MSTSRLGLLEEGYKRGLLNDEQKSLYEEAVRRGLITPQTQFESAAQEQSASSFPRGRGGGGDVYQVEPGTGVGFGTTFKAGFVENPETQLRIYANQLFPDDPNAMDRMGFLNGKPVFVNDEGRLQQVRGGAGDVVGGIASNAPEIIGGTAGSLAGSTTGTSIALGALGSAAGRAFKRIIGNLVFDEPQSPLANAIDIGTEGVLDAAGGAAMVGVGRLANRRAVSGLTDLDPADAARIRLAVKSSTGIDLDLAQITNLPKLKALKTWAANFPGDASAIIQASDDVIAGQTDDAIRRVLDVVSESDDAVRQGMRGINAAEAVIEAARLEAADRASRIYQRAFQENVNIDPSRAVSLLQSSYDNAKGSQKAALGRALRLFRPAGGEEAIDLSLSGMHGTKLAIDAMLERTGPTAVDRITRRQLVEAKNALVDAMIDASPTYAQAHSTFMFGMENYVEPLMNSPVGVLAKIPDQNAASAAAKLFNNGNITVSGMRQARQAIEAIEQAQPEFSGTWNGMVRQWLEAQLNAAGKETQTGSTLNLAGKFRQRVFGTDSQKAALRAALGPDASGVFEITMEALEMAARTPTASSATAFNQQISQELGGSTGSIVRGLMQPRQTVIEAIDDRFIQSQAVRIAEALTDPSKVSQLNALKQMRPSTERALIAAGIVGFIGAREAGEGFMSGPPDQIPPALLSNE